ncbi:MAG: FAD:protein FMN transferase [Prevotella sp.]|jgi:thiamine biosynthesis lipoprotein|nr:FAD:protein FMN transferase [Prevotella sp.]
MRYIIFCFCILFLTNCKGKDETFFEEQGKIFHTTYNIKYRYTGSLQKEIEEALARFDDSLNPFKPTSIISKVNNNEEVELDTLFVNVFNRAQEVAFVSDGMFDITVSPLINVWGFGFENYENVSPRVIDSLKRFVGYEKIELKNGKIVKTNPHIKINTSAIAKGYATDVIAALLEKHGIKNYMVNIGGEIRSRGYNEKGRCWRAGITQPVDDGIFDYEHLQTILKVCDRSMATSGDYRKYYIKDGKRYSHTINPKTGYPAETNILSATVLADDCMTADAYATVFMLTDTALTRRIAEEKSLSYMLVMGISDSSYITVKSKYFDVYVAHD